MDSGYCDNSEALYSDYFDHSSSLALDPADARTAQHDAQTHSPVTPVRRRNHQLLRPSNGYSPSFYPPPIQTYMHRAVAAPSNGRMLSSLLESQNKVVKMVEDVSKRLGALENVVAGLNTKASNGASTTSCSSSPDERKRLPSQFCTCTLGCVLCMYNFFNFFFRKPLQKYTMHLMIMNNLNLTWGTYMYVHIYVYLL